MKRISVKGVKDMNITTTYIILYSIILLPIIIIACISFVIDILKKKKLYSKSKLPFIIGGIIIGIFILFALIGCIYAFLNMN